MIKEGLHSKAKIIILASHGIELLPPQQKLKNIETI